MASQPSAERNLLRLRAWAQRTQEISPAKDPNPENVPLFGQPYKTNKGDELSTRIQKMLGSYEVVNDPYPFAMEPSPIPAFATVSQSDQEKPNADQPTKPPFHNQVHATSNQNQKAPTTGSPVRMSTASSSPEDHRLPPSLSHPPLNPSPLRDSVHQQMQSEVNSDLREHVSPPQEMSLQSADAKPLPFTRSSDHENPDTDTKENVTFQHQGSTNPSSECPGTIDAPTFHLNQSPKDPPLLPPNKANTLPTQAFPSLLSSKQPSVVMTQKPTAYVRPMDGQDQVVSESPELKPSPEPYGPLPEIISKSDLGKTKILPQYLEMKTNEAHKLCVEDILREMTHSWPPLLTGIKTPRTDEHTTSPFPAKEADHVSTCPGQKNLDSCTADTRQLSHSSSPSFQAAHSREEESGSSSDSESSSRSESDSESTAEEPPQHPASISVKTEPDAPAGTHHDWQLRNWIRPSQQNCTNEGQTGARVSESPAHKQPPPTHSSKHSSVEVFDPAVESKPQEEFTENLGKPQLFGENPQDNLDQQSALKTPSAELNSCSSSKNQGSNANSSKQAKAGCADHTEAALTVKCKENVVKREKDPSLTDRPKVKTKTGHSKKSSDAKKDTKRTFKHAPLDKRKIKAEPEPDVKPLSGGSCPSCGVRYPDSCSCPSPSPAPLDHLSPVPPVRIKAKSDTTNQKGTKTPHKTTHKHSERTEHRAVKRSRDPYKLPRSLLVRIDLSLLPRVPQTSGNHPQTASNTKRSAPVTEQHGGGGDASTNHKPTKSSRKSIPQDVEVDSKAAPKKKRRLEDKNTSTHTSVKLEKSSKSTEGRDRKQVKKNPVPLPHQKTPKDSKETSKEPVRSNDTRKLKRSGQHTEHPHSEKKVPKSSLTVPSTLKTNRPLLRHEERRYPVKHYIKEAKKLKHKADAESDKLSKAFNYLEAAMFFVESGIEMEKDPQISTSSYTMFAETVELLKFVLKLKNTVDPSTPATEKDFIALCLKCQSLLQMAMFRHKHKTALKYSKTLTEHFNTQKSLDSSVLSKVAHTPSPMPHMPSPASTSTSSGPGSNHSGSASAPDPVGGTVVVPQAIEQVAFSYVNITVLVLSAHDLWEQAEEMAQKGSGLLTELDTVMGPLSLTSSMSSVVRYTRQGVQWLRLDSQKVK